MPVIKILPEELANKIAAGEVVERPASVVKELVENSLDSGATKVFVQAVNGGKKEISVTDNGSGMRRDDLLLALERHATSKIASDRDLFSIRTLGFRGEALPSIGSVSKMEITSCFNGDMVGNSIYIEGGVIKDVKEVGAPTGTTVKIFRLFYNTPARLKFLKSVSTELDHLTAVVIRTALGHPGVHFRFLHNGREVLDFPPTQKIEHRLRALWGKNVTGALLEIRPRNDEDLRVSGYLSPPDLTRAGRRHVYTYLNGRWINDPLLRSAIYAGYKPFLTKGRYPLAALFLDMDPASVDVNVHPTKNEVRFAASRRVYETVRETIYETLLAGASGPQASLTERTRLVETRERTPSFAPPPSPAPSYPRVSEPPAAAPAMTMPEAAVPEIRPEPETRPSAAPPPSVPFWEKKRPSLEPLKVLAQLGNSYILCQAADGLVILDQHAAHERIVYETLKKGFSRAKPVSQHLLMPEIIELSPMDYSILDKASDRLKRLGLILEPFGGASMVVKAVPALISQNEVQDLVAELVDGLNELPHASHEELVIDKALTIMACHGSVRAHQSLSREEMVRLVEDLAALDAPLHCPHGRPVFVRLGYEQIEKELKRR